MVKKFLIIISLAAYLQAAEKRSVSFAESADADTEMPSGLSIVTDQDSLQAEAAAMWAKAQTPAGLATLDKKFAAWFANLQQTNPEQAADGDKVLAAYQQVILKQIASEPAPAMSPRARQAAAVAALASSPRHADRSHTHGATERKKTKKRGKGRHHLRMGPNTLNAKLAPVLAQMAQEETETTPSSAVLKADKKEKGSES